MLYYYSVTLNIYLVLYISVSVFRFKIEVGSPGWLVRQAGLVLTGLESGIYTEWCEKRKKYPLSTSSVRGNALLMKDGLLVCAERKAPLTQITTLCKQGEQKNISYCSNIRLTRLIQLHSLPLSLSTIYDSQGGIE